MSRRVPGRYIDLLMLLVVREEHKIQNREMISVSVERMKDVAAVTSFGNAFQNHAEKHNCQTVKHCLTGMLWTSNVVLVLNGGRCVVQA